MMIVIFSSQICIIGYQVHNLVMFYPIYHKPAHCLLVMFYKNHHGSRTLNDVLSNLSKIKKLLV
jgi:hypothetical protein